MDSLFGAKKNVEEMREQGGGGVSTPTPSGDAPQPVNRTAKRAALRKRLQTKTEPKVTLRAAVLGNEGTGKSGLVLSHLYHHKKRSMIIDIDGGMVKNLAHYPGAEEFIHVENPTELGENEKGETVIDYVETFETIKDILAYVKENVKDFDAIVIDGLSTLWDFASKQVKVDKYIQPGGEVDFRFWQIRGNYFLGVIEITRSLTDLDQIFIGHENMKLVSGQDRVVTKKGQVIMMDKTPKPIQQLHRMVDQKIWTEKIVDEKAKGGKQTRYKATYQKARPFLTLEEEEFDFAEKQGPKVRWEGERVLGAFQNKGVI